MTDRSNDGSIAELSKRVDFGFEQTDKRLARVEDDVRALRAEMNGRFDKVDARFDKVDARFDRVYARFDKVDARFDRMEARFDAFQRQMTRFFAGTLSAVIAGVIILVATVLLHS